MRLWSSILTAVLAVLAVCALAAPASAKTGSFVDDDTSRYEPYIETAHAQGVVSGCNPPGNDRVCPHYAVTRGSMAIMLARALGVPPSASDHFADDDGHIAEGAIDGLIDAGMAMGCEIEHVCPDRVITRGEMAALIVRAFEWEESAKTDQFVDLKGSTFREPLAKLADRGGLLACDAPVNRELCPRATVRRDEAIFAVITAMGLQPADPARPESDGRSLGFGDGFDELTLWDGRTPSARNRVSLTNGGYEGTALRVRIPKGSHFGTDFHLHLEDAAAKPPEQLFFRYYLKLDENWRTTSAGKLPGFSGVYGSTGKGGFRSQPTQPGWSARLMFEPNNGDDPRVSLGYYVYHLGQQKRYGDGLHWNEAGKLRPGEWYCLEGAVELNTPGLADGALRAWVDETPALDVSGLEFRRLDEPEIKIESFWFNVYYGGKAVANQNLGLTVDEVMVDTERIGCGAGKGMTSSTDGDFDGDGYRDRARWDRCAQGHCFLVERNTWRGRAMTHHNGDGAWFSLDSHRSGMATGDVDGDGKGDIVYLGRCDSSTRCWRSHTAKRGLEKGANWGAGARFSPGATSLILGDWNGDGLDDLVYRGSCGDEARPCWRVHLSSGEVFHPPENWGGLPASERVRPLAVDLDEDGYDDLVFQAPCEESLCWFSQVSDGTAFAEPTVLGPVLELDHSWEWIDIDGDGTADLASWINADRKSWIETRFMRDGTLGEPVELAEFDEEVRDVAMRRRSDRAPVQAIVSLACPERVCVRTLIAASPHELVHSDHYRDVIWDRPDAPQIT